MSETRGTYPAFEAGETVYATMEPLFGYKGVTLEAYGDQHNILCQFEGLSRTTLMNKGYLSRTPPAPPEDELTALRRRYAVLEAAIRKLNEGVYKGLRPGPDRVTLICDAGCEPDQLRMVHAADCPLKAALDELDALTAQE